MLTIANIMRLTNSKKRKQKKKKHSQANNLFSDDGHVMSDVGVAMI